MDLVVHCIIKNVMIAIAIIDFTLGTISEFSSIEIRFIFTPNVYIYSYVIVVSLKFVLSAYFLTIL